MQRKSAAASPSFSRSCEAHAKEELVPARILRYLRVEGCPQERALASCDNHALHSRESHCALGRHVVLCEHLHARAAGQYGWRSDEYRVKGGPATQRQQARRRGELRLEGVDLAAEEVAAHLHVQAADEHLAALLLACNR